MTSLLKHIDDLFSASARSESPINQWTGTDLTGIDEKARSLGTGNELFEESIGPDSVLNLFSSNLKANTAVLSLLKKDVSQNLVQPLLSILSSERTNDEISSEMTELLGFDNLELIMNVLADRVSINAEGQLRRNQMVTNSDQSANHIHMEEVQVHSFSEENIRRQLQEQLDANAARPVVRWSAASDPEILPHVYSSGNGGQGLVLPSGGKFVLPIGTVRNTYDDYEEVIVPPATQTPTRSTERQKPIAELDEIVRGSFSGYTTLNRVQSIVFPTAYGSNENLLICAPTGAGKTEVAVMTILRVINEHRRDPDRVPKPFYIRDSIDKSAFKVIYVAPMKALAAEIVRKLRKRLQWLSIDVRELTGDMQLTKVEIAQTQIIVTTPEKWDVVTRKPTGEGEIAFSIKLLIIDEVHLLNEERGAVIETIVARTLRQVESSQSMIRIVGLSATLPNYCDVADFLCVSRQKGLFYFDSSFRPIPLTQHFLGIRGKPNSVQSRKNFDAVTFQKVSELVTQGHQVMVFVHSRRETVKTAMTLRETSILEGNTEYFSCDDHPQFYFFRQKVGELRNKELKLLFDTGFGIHHAGMLRSDRSLIEKLFSEKVIKVLCCTATLAWGVNLPAHAVIIKGTQVYDTARGKFIDLSVLDVLQIFGRAGRPGMEASGEGYICTTEDKLTHYLDAVTSSVPIESQYAAFQLPAFSFLAFIPLSRFQAGMADSLNAEIALGTVSNARDAVQWLGYTYLFVRMRMNPFVYGIPMGMLSDDPYLGGKRNELIALAAQKLANARMITYDAQDGQFQITDVGRIAAKYYIRYKSIEIFNESLVPKMSEADVLAMISKSVEFDQVQVRESEITELEGIMDRVPCEVKGGTDTTQGKVNILLQGYISREVVDDFALVSDMAYVAQNAGRIVRATAEIVMSKKWANVTATLINVGKAIETRLWPYEHPLRQFSLKPETLLALERWADDLPISQLADSDAAELGKLIHLNEAHGRAIINHSKQFPFLQMAYVVQPVAWDVLRISLKLTRAFEWNTKIHSGSEPFWVWVEDGHGLHILQLAHVMFHKDTDIIMVDFFILAPKVEPPGFVTIKAMSDRWIGSETAIAVSLNVLLMPVKPQPNTKVVSVPFLAISNIKGPALFKNLFLPQIQSLNTLQTQAFWNMVCAKHNSLLCAPAGSGRSVLAQMAVWWSLLQVPRAWVMIVAPNKTAALETLADLRHASHISGIPVQYISDKNQIFSRSPSRIIRVVSARILLHAFTTRLPDVLDLRLVVCEGLEQLDPAYELALSLLRLATQSSETRFVYISASLNDPSDLGKWLGVGDLGATSFRPKDRDQSLTTLHQTFSIPYSASLLKAMVKPAHRAIHNAGPGSSVLIFVPSQSQSRSIAQDVITQCTLELETARGYVHEVVSNDVLNDYANRFRDTSLVEFAVKGVGFFHPGLDKQDRTLMLEMFAEGILRVLVVPKDSCWSVPVRASVVIVMGTQYVQMRDQGVARQIKDYTLPDLVRMQSRAIQQSGHGRFHLFSQSETLETYSRFLGGGLPLESQLHEGHTLRDWANSFFAYHLDRGRIMDILSFTFLAQRLNGNPSYYGFTSQNLEENLSILVDKLFDNLATTRDEA